MSQWQQRQIKVNVLYLKLTPSTEIIVNSWMLFRLVVLFWGFYIALTKFQSYCNIEAGDTQSVKLKCWDTAKGPIKKTAKF